MRYHFIFNSNDFTCKVYDGICHTSVFQCEMRDTAVNGPGFERWGRCPRGAYTLGAPVAVDEPSMGLWFIPVLDVPSRSGIGIHGGGSGLSDPFAARQGWVVTHGCLRVQNEDLSKLVDYVRQGQTILTVEGP